MAYDMMLDTQWESVADMIFHWIIGGMGSLVGSLAYEKKRIVLSLNYDFETFKDEEKQHLISELSEILNVDPDEIHISVVWPGTVKLLIELPAESAEKLQLMIKRKDPRLPFIVNSVKILKSNNLDVDLVDLYFKLEAAFNEEELKHLCFQFRTHGVKLELENLPGTTKSSKTMELILFCERQAYIPELIDLCRKLRPRTKW